MSDSAEVRSTVRRLVRRKDNKLIAGVSGGLADYTGLDPAIFRVAFLALVLFAGGGLVLYLFAWLLIPRAGSPESYGERLLKQAARAPWLIVLLVAGGALLFVEAAGGDFAPTFVWAGALIAIGVVLLRRDQPVTSDASESAVTARLRFRRERSPLGWIAIGLAIISTGVGALAHNLGIVRLEVGDYAALALLIIGIGLAIGAWLGRARWLILIGLAMAPAVVASSLVDMPLRGAIGSHYLYPTSLEEVPERYELLAGTVTLDLSEIDFGDGSTDISIEAGVGNVNIYVPRSVIVNLDARTNYGYISAFRNYNDGFDARVVTEWAPKGAVGTLSIDVEGGLGDVYVHPSYEDRNFRGDDRRGARAKDGDGPARKKDDGKRQRNRRRNR